MNIKTPQQVMTLDEKFHDLMDYVVSSIIEKIDINFSGDRFSTTILFPDPESSRFSINRFMKQIKDKFAAKGWRIEIATIFWSFGQFYIDLEISA